MNPLLRTGKANTPAPATTRSRFHVSLGLSVPFPCHPFPILNTRSVQLSFLLHRPTLSHYRLHPYRHQACGRLSAQSWRLTRETSRRKEVFRCVVLSSPSTRSSSTQSSNRPICHSWEHHRTPAWDAVPPWSACTSSIYASLHVANPVGFALPVLG
jgi:hypothetical protein